MRCSTPRAHLIRRLSAAGVALAATAVPLAAAAPHASAGTSAVSLWARTSRPAATWHFHTGVELGVRFTPAVRGKITAIRYYRVARDTGAHVGHLWNRNGRLLAAVTFRHQSRTGWQVARLSKPVPVAAHSTYTASFHTTSGFAAASRSYFAHAHHSRGGALVAPAGRNGVFHRGRAAFPTNTYRSTNFWADVTFTPTTSSTQPAPSSSAFPNSSNTGVRTTSLRVVRGSYTVSTAGAVVSGLDITGGLVIRASHVTVKNSRVRCEGISDWCAQLLGSNDTVSDVTIGGGADGSTFTGAIGVWSGNTGSRLLRVNVHHTSDGLRIDGNTLVQDSYVHDLNFCCGYHSDGSQTTQGSNITFEHNTIQGGSNDPIWVKSDSGPISNVTIDRNKLQGTGTSSNMSSYDLGVEQNVSNIKVTNNVFTGIYQVAPAEQFAYGAWSGNTLNGRSLGRP